MPISHCKRGDPCGMCGTGLDLVIVPPSMIKSFEKFPKLGLLWRIAFERLKQVETIVMIGMSLPDSDYYLMWLIREAMTKRKKPPSLVIVNPAKREAMPKTKKLIGVEKAAWSHDLDSFIAGELERGIQWDLGGPIPDLHKICNQNAASRAKYVPRILNMGLYGYP